MIIEELRFDDRGLLPVIAQDAASGEVLMLAYADREAVQATLATAQAHYHSRSRDETWRKGETSGNVQKVVEVRYDCDEDALLYRVEQTGPACHTGHRSCFYRGVEVQRVAGAGGGAAAPGRGTAAEGDAVAASEPRHTSGGAARRDDAPGGSGIGEAMALLEDVVAARLHDLPEGSYVRRVHERGVGYAAQKVVEEAGESVVAALEHKDEELVAEAADLLFHLTILLAERGVPLGAVAEELQGRHRAAPDRV